MKKGILIVLTVVFSLAINAQRTPNIEIGQWREHLSYYITDNITKAEDKLLVSCKSALFYFDPKTEKMTTLSKINGLSDAGLGVTAYDSTTKTIIVTYENGNIDIVQNSHIYNIPDIKNRIIEGSKVINSIYFKDKKAYLACGFGVVVLDLIRHEIYDTWYLGDNSSAIQVNCIYTDDTAIYAGTQNGLLYADKDSKVLAVSENWKKKDLDFDGNKEVKFILKLNSNQLLLNIVRKNSTLSYLVKYDGKQTQMIDEQAYVTNLKKIGDNIGACEFKGFTLYDTNYNNVFHVSDGYQPTHLSSISWEVNDFFMDNDSTVWFAHNNRGLVKVPMTHFWDYKTYYPDGPMTDYVYNITVSESGKVFVCPGGKDINNANKFHQGDLYIYNGYWWSKLVNSDEYGLQDFLSCSIDPNDENHLIVASWRNGVAEIMGDSIINVYDSSNTNNNLLPFNDNYYRIAGAEYDVSGNIIIANSLSSRVFAYRNYKGYWGSFLTNAFIPPDEEVLGLVLDNFNFYKLIYTSNNRIVLFNNDGQMLYIDPNNGSLVQTNRINCMVQDKDGEIWIGTEKGIKVIYSLSGAFDGNTGYTSEVECNNIIYSENNIAQYLLSFENITCIAIDGANRKWIGTERNGIYVLSENGSKEIHHFTEENSPLLSNKIICLAQNPLTGEVFIGTDRGIVSFRSESTGVAQKKESLKVYPNPVRENYDGVIAIKGFTDNSDVRITDARGREVIHLKSLGGQAIWDGRNFNGQKVATGVYFIFSSSEDGEIKATGKVLIIK